MPDTKEVFKILFVDDEENVLRSLKRLFMDEDSIEVFTASSGREGLEVLKNNDITVIVSDQRMPEMSGVEFLEKAKKLSPDAIRIVLTGYADINAAIDAVNKGGVHRYLAKPWNDNDIVLAIWDSIERNRLIKENKRLTDLTRKQNEELKKWSSELELYVQQQTIDLTRQNKELNKLNEKLRKNFRDFISAFYNLLELRNKIIYTHSNNVATLVSEMAQKMGLSGSESETVIVAAQLHDIGKIGVPDAMLIKNIDEFNAEEKEGYIKHPIIGQAAIDFVEDLRDAGVLIRHHHEWYNGGGFPDKLRYEKIPMGSRIISIADKFDHLTSRAKEALDTESALKKIQALLGTQFDPDLYQSLSKAAHERITTAIPETEYIEVEIKPDDLAPGLVLSRDVRSGTGLMLLRKGTTLSEKNIDTLRRGYHLDPSKSGVFVWGRRKQA